MHKPVMLNEVLEALEVGPGERVVDATLGGAGHAETIMERLGKGGVLLGLDRDSAALELASERLALMPGRSIFRKASFADLRRVAEGCGLHEVNAILMDLGISSIQLDDAERGFSFQRAGPLDMRMDRDAGMTAWNIVNEFSEMELANLLRNFGEERRNRRIAHAIVSERSRGTIDDTVQLAEIVERAKGGRRGRCHPATQAFMALRIAVNDELGVLKEGLRQGLELLAVGGRIAVLSFHSLEDRIVKTFFKSHAGREESLQAGGSRWIGEEPPVELVTKKPVTAGEDEMKMNPRARSAKLRVAERCG